MYADLREFVAALEEAGELVRVKAEVSPILEIAAIAERISREPAAHESEYARGFDPKHAGLGGRALLFENVKGAKGIPVLINAYGSYRRMEMALGCHPQGPVPGGFEALAKKIREFLKPQPAAGVMEKLRRGLDLLKLASVAPRVVEKGRCQEVVKVGEEVNLLELPILKCWPYDGEPEKLGLGISAQEAGTAEGGGRYITFGGVYTIDPEDAGKGDDQPRLSLNVGMYRLQVIDRRRTAMHWHMHHDGARHWRAWKEVQRHRRTGKKEVDEVPGMPCAVVLGGESVLPYAATAPLGPGISELLLAGFLYGRGIELVRCKTIDLHVPANAEIVLEGYVSTQAGPPGWRAGEKLELEHEVLEGPFGDHTGFYSLPDRYPVFTVTAITHRRNPIYPATVVGRPPQEDYYLGKASERLFLPLLQVFVPDVLDYHLPMFGCFHNCVFVKIRKEYPLQARRVMHAIWGLGQLSWTKFVVVVDEEVNVHDEEEVLFYVCANCDPGRDVELVHGPVDILDHAAPGLGVGCKMGLDATRKIAGEEVRGHAVRAFPPILKQDPAIQELIQRRWKEYGL